MMKPEPSERLSGRGAGPGCWRGTKRRKNSSTSSSSIPGTWGSALRRTAWVVLMLTTAPPCSSTRRVKSGSSRACAKAAAQNAASQSAARLCMTRIFSSPVTAASLRLAVLNGIRDALHARGRRLADHGHHVIGDFARIDVDRAHARETGAHHVAPALQRLDEHRYRGEAVRIHHLPYGLRLAHAALELDDLVESGQLGGEPPAREMGRGRRGVFHPPGARRVARPHHVARDIADRQLREHELLDALPGGVEGDR